MVEFIFSIGEIFYIHAHKHLCSILGNNKYGHLITLHQKMSSNVITHWLERWVSQTHQMENNNNTILDVFNYQKTKSNTSGGVKNFKFASVIFTKLKAHSMKSLSNPFISSRVPTAWKYDCSLTFLYWIFSRNPKKNISDRAHTVFPFLSIPMLIKFWNC